MGQSTIKKQRKAVRKQKDLLAAQVLETITSASLPVRLAFCFRIIFKNKKNVVKFK